MWESEQMKRKKGNLAKVIVPHPAFREIRLIKYYAHISNFVPKHPRQQFSMTSRTVVNEKLPPSLYSYFGCLRFARVCSLLSWFVPFGSCSSPQAGKGR